MNVQSPPEPFKADLEDKLKIYNLFREYVKHEDTLRSSRTGWLLTIQGFLFAAQGALMGQNNGPAQKAQILIAFIGLLVTRVSRVRAEQQDKVYLGLEQQYCQLQEQLDSDDNNFIKTTQLPRLRYGNLVNPIRRTRSLYYEQIFSLAWVAVLLYLAVAYLSYFEVIRRYVLHLSAPLIAR